MLTHLIRRYFLTLLLAPLLLFTFLVYAPGGAYAWVLRTGLDPTACRYCGREPYSLTLINDFNLDEPWPLSYLTWLWDPQVSPNYDLEGSWMPREVNLFGITFKGSGAINGDLGDSTAAYGLTVGNVIGDGLGQIAVPYMALLLVLTFLTSVMRFRRGYRGPIKLGTYQRPAKLLPVV